MRTPISVVVVVVLTQDCFNSGCEWLLLAFFLVVSFSLPSHLLTTILRTEINHCDPLQEYLAPIELAPDYEIII